MKRKFVVIASVTAIVLILLVSYIDISINPAEEKSNPFIPLLPPPASATDYGNPLNTTAMGFTVYYYNPSGWVLNTTTTAFWNFTDHGSYYDGFVRIYQDTSGATYTNNDPTQPYADVQMRIRSDGWILAWMDRSNASKANLVFWGRKALSNGQAGTPTAYYTTGNPVANATTPARAIEYVYYVTGTTFPTYGNLKCYDYQYATATKFIVFSKQGITVSNNIYTYHTAYSTFPSSSNTGVIASWASYNSQIFVNNGGTSAIFYVKKGADSPVTIVSDTKSQVSPPFYGGQTTWTSYDVLPYVALDTSTKWQLYVGCNWGGQASANSQVAIMTWLS